MRHLLAFTVVATLGMSMAGGAQAASPASARMLSVPASGAIELVSGGCGPGGFRDRFGYCRPIRGPVYRGCPPGFHPTPYGCRRNF